jgi:hypothetical protein
MPTMVQWFQRPSKEASSTAAAMLVLIQAITGVAFVLVLLAGDPDRTFLVVACTVFGLAMIWIWLASRPGLLLRDTMSWVFSRKARPERVDYRLSRKPVSFRRFGTNQPPSVEQVRDLKCGTTNNWAPSRTSKR